MSCETPLAYTILVSCSRSASALLLVLDACGALWWWEVEVMNVILFLMELSRRRGEFDIITKDEHGSLGMWTWKVRWSGQSTNYQCTLRYLERGTTRSGERDNISVGRRYTTRIELCCHICEFGVDIHFHASARARHVGSFEDNFLPGCPPRAAFIPRR